MRTGLPVLTGKGGSVVAEVLSSESSCFSIALIAIRPVPTGHKAIVSQLELLPLHIMLSVAFVLIVAACEARDHSRGTVRVRSNGM